ncbi:pheromone alpha factor receptor [Ascochyta rabiei]|uniref:Mating-type factor pheromone receptor n=1 Tax=Didymella rabiei TaxID=5454 RepID=A0A163BXA9_DIDRA|nr:pheromone alpha factor receptor [Ascochyta rabiei]KZM22067.1 mating-type factor pheromone receptor [Ascochyta rabiei]UPX17511.1 pheromone alpha factor receptor [Ascochyta rabiei]
MEDAVQSMAVDPAKQPVTLRYPDGSTFEVDMELINRYRLYSARLAISYGTQLGSTVLLLVVLLLLTRPEKRKSSIFILNALCLTGNSVRCILTCCFVTGNLLHPYTQLSGDPSLTTASDLAVSITSTTLSFIVTALVMASLSLQVWVVCVTTGKLHRILIMGTTTTVALISVGYKFAFMITSNRATMSLMSLTPDDRIGSGSYITQAIAILLYSCVFIWKLGYAIAQRRRLKMLQFGPMQIVFIMGCQTMVIPGIFSTLQFHRLVLEAVPEIGTMVLTVVCIFLPLSAIWAGVANDSALAYRGRNGHQHLMNSQSGRGSSTLATSDSTTAFEKSRQMSCSACTHPKKREEFDTPEPSPTGKRSAAGDNGIHVGREFTVRHEDIALEHF